jgi:hypothetical protein
MYPPTANYVQQEFRRKKLHDIIGPVYVRSQLLQRGNGTGNFRESVFRLRTGAKIMSDIDHKSSNNNFKNTVSNRVTNRQSG